MEGNSKQSSFVDKDNLVKKLLEEQNEVKEKPIQTLQLAKKSKLLLIRTGNQCLEEAKNNPIPRMLFSEFWHEGEFCILFADTNLGKSILAVQIADSISRGIPIRGFKLDAVKQKVLYFDFELSDKQFENRYSKDYKNHFKFDDYFLRVDINPDAEIPNNQDFEDYLQKSIEDAIQETGARILIIDNITYLKTETEKAKDALPLVKGLKELKNKYKLSILALAHTPKRDSSKPITKNDIQGSKMLVNFVDSSFAVGESQKEKQIRYLKQIKQRNTEHIYDTGNVCICEIIKPNNFLHFDFIGFGTEHEHLRHIIKKDDTLLIEQMKDLRSKGHTQRDIQKELGISLGKVNKLLNK